MWASLKKLLFAPVVSVALFAAAVAIQPASLFLYYQPEEPRG
jgi:cyclic lactone autoinducer peptide